MALIFFASDVFSQAINDGWEQELNKSLTEFTNCENVALCNAFIGQSLKTVYNINDFYSEKLGRYLFPHEIASFVGESDRWTLLGHAYEPDALSEAQKYANEKKAAIAVYKSDNGQGHMALILPGDLIPSGSWGVKVPNTASFFIGEPEKSYISKGLSYGFKKNLIKDVLIYARKY
ncbi:hypothetical protein C900_04166 [Fulvivirga imtechensis AK7]|uniref:Peptidase C39-like domain-containing protein n=1 Tax=Fulvivirga imtechensis AK7 TaxID=1237149 RepID=L8K056_9BACT|nr:hypothetical protein [Fulvivirga imtechensis]ELR73314.1 hypothetical protein C900_04166 [Fulvivirga imtechensis AK7]